MHNPHKKKKAHAGGDSTAELRITMGAGEFKTKCLDLMDQVHERGVEIVVTKRGIPVCKVVRAAQETGSPIGFLAGTVLYYKDPTEPTGEVWEAAE